MIEFDATNAAVEAALAAGARYADARVMHRRHESMSARNGEVRELVQDEDSGLGVRALVGSGWGFFAVPHVSDPAARAAETTLILRRRADGAAEVACRRRATW
jgi:TldD protein